MLEVISGILVFVPLILSAIFILVGLALGIGRKLILALACVAVVIAIASARSKLEPIAPPSALEQMSAKITPLGHTIITREGDRITSITITADPSRLNNLRGACMTLSQEREAANKTCSVEIVFDDLGGRGELRGCDGGFLGHLNADAARFLKDQVEATASPVSPLSPARPR